MKCQLNTYLAYSKELQFLEKIDIFKEVKMESKTKIENHSFV